MIMHKESYQEKFLLKEQVSAANSVGPDHMSWNVVTDLGPHLNQQFAAPVHAGFLAEASHQVNIKIWTCLHNFALIFINYISRYLEYFTINKATSGLVSKVQSIGAKSRKSDT